MIAHTDIDTTMLRRKIKQYEINFGGNKQLKIYGTLQCKSGKRMKKENRVFFISEKEAITMGYRPCGHCMKSKYKKWLNKKEQFN
jgi:methylphosphotriester-DNA--protein-cysteine methyltransferase